MITDVYIIRSNESLNKFFELDADTGNWDWTTILENAMIFKTMNEAESMLLTKKLNETAYIYQIPYSVIQPRKKKSGKKPTKRKSIHKIKSKKR